MKDTDNQMKILIGAYNAHFLSKKQIDMLNEITKELEVHESVKDVIRCSYSDDHIEKSVSEIGLRATCNMELLKHHHYANSDALKLGNMIFEYTVTVESCGNGHIITFATEYSLMVFTMNIIHNKETSDNIDEMFW